MNISNYKVVEVHISQIKNGDTILHLDGNIRTVCNKNIRVGGFCGTTLFGDSYKMGTVKVKKILMPHWNGNICSWFKK